MCTLRHCDCGGIQVQQFAIRCSGCFKGGLIGQLVGTRQQIGQGLQQVLPSSPGRPAHHPGFKTRSGQQNPSGLALQRPHRSHGWFRQDRPAGSRDRRELPKSQPQRHCAVPPRDGSQGDPVPITAPPPQTRCHLQPEAMILIRAARIHLSVWAGCDSGDDVALLVRWDRHLFLVITTFSRICGSRRLADLGES